MNPEKEAVHEMHEMGLAGISPQGEISQKTQKHKNIQIDTLISTLTPLATC